MHLGLVFPTAPAPLDRPGGQQEQPPFLVMPATDHRNASPAVIRIEPLGLPPGRARLEPFGPQPQGDADEVGRSAQGAPGSALLS